MGDGLSFDEWLNRELAKQAQRWIAGEYCTDPDSPSEVYDGANMQNAWRAGYNARATEED